MDPRKEKGIQIASAGKIRKMNGVWVVPSQSGSGVYIVNQVNSICSCPDFETRGCKCKHIYAVEFKIERRKNRDGSTTVIKQMVLTERKTYPQDWTNYNHAQTHEKEVFESLLRDLCSGLPQPVSKGPGRPKLPISDVVFSSVLKVYTTFSGRRATSDIRNAKERGLVSSQPHYNTVFNHLEKPEMTPVLKSLIEQSAMPLKSIESSFSVDASGFSTGCYDRWFDQKYGKVYSQNKWLKAHITIGNKTNIVTAVEVTDSFTHDSTQFMPLIEDTAKNFNIEKVMADKAYLKKDHVEALVNSGIDPYIPFKSNTTGEGSETWRNLFHFYNFHRNKFLKHYHERSNVESTFSMIKRKFGTALRSKSNTSQVNEVLCKILAHNICCLVHSIFELGIEAEFWKQAA